MSFRKFLVEQTLPKINDDYFVKTTFDAVGHMDNVQLSPYTICNVTKVIVEFEASQPSEYSYDSMIVTVSLEDFLDNTAQIKDMDKDQMKEMIHKVLTSIKELDGDTEFAKDVIKLFKKHGKSHPDLAAIEKSVKK